MRDFLDHRKQMLAGILFSLWIYLMWRLAGMPAPGTLGRLIPGLWFLASLLWGKGDFRRWFLPITVLFTVSSWLWAVWEPGWYIAAASAVAGLMAMGLSTAVKGKTGVIRGILPVLLLVVLTAEVNSDEVRFAELSVSITGIGSESFGEWNQRSGDIQPGIGHHTPVFPVIISPGLLLGDNFIRTVPVIICFVVVMLLSSLAGPAAAVLSALVYPGFGTLGLALSGWMAAGLFALSLAMRDSTLGKLFKYLAVLLLIALKMRYAGLAAGILAADYACMKPRKGKWLVPVAVSAGMLMFLLADKYLLGGQVFWLRYGNIEAVKLIWINVFHRPFQTLSCFGWSLFDPEAGLITRAPWTIAAFYGLGILRGRSPHSFKKLVIPSAVYWIVLVVWQGTAWHGLPAPTGRVFLPMLPMLASGLREVINRRETRLLLGLSIAVAALTAVYPHSRANFADGTDAILSLIGGSAGFSMVRSNPLNILIPVILSTLYLASMVKKPGDMSLSVLIIITAGFVMGIEGRVTDAEDLPPETIQGALLYPRIPDPVERYFWFNSRERMVELSEPGHSLLFTGISPGDTILIEASSEGGDLLVAGGTYHIQTRLTELPPEYTFVGRRVSSLPNLPEHRLSTILKIPVVSDSVRITHAGGASVFLDRAGVL